MALPTTECGVLVVGSGNAGFSAAVSAAETKVGDRKPTILLIDKCPEDWVGGNSYFTAGAYRTAHDGLADVLPLVNNVSAEQAAKIDLAPYTTEDFQKDMDNVCMGRSDQDLARVLISDSRTTIQRLKENGIRFQLSFNRQAYEVDGRIKFCGGLCLKTDNGGKGLIEEHIAAAQKSCVLMSWNTGLTRVQRQTTNSGHRYSATVLVDGQESTISAKSIIFAAGGFESNPKLRSQHLGPGWDMAMDANADPSIGDRDASNEYTKSGYPLGLMLNVEGNRFVDEGIAMRNYTYAKFGRAILQQPDHEYRPERLNENRFTADTIEDLADVLSKNGLRDRDGFVLALNEYNEAVYAFQRENSSAKWDPSILDGVSTQSKTKKPALAKSNWALPMEQGPFLAVKVTCGVTFTFGGLKVDPETAALISATTRRTIPGLFCVGEMMGGLFYENHPGGSGLTSGAVFGRRAGRAAAGTS
ncbi:fumarate reductase flavoprotein subunit [Colletotrichum musicola]|uniref:Fumarate reductase flavoprotein subunit n=1 Tax=Colletotrichum musicola TaxID=2175873 RepID=A0A8H6IWN8_9PEZI|nr:fumarate reductase flavoprotein subunit [Colletotrichum musicola]